MVAVTVSDMSLPISKMFVGRLGPPHDVGSVAVDVLPEHLEGHLRFANSSKTLTKNVRIAPEPRKGPNLNLPDLGLAVGLRCSPVHLLATPPASLLSTRPNQLRSRI